jgi:hypothetical protein
MAGLLTVKLLLQARTSNKQVVKRTSAAMDLDNDENSPLPLAMKPVSVLLSSGCTCMRGFSAFSNHDRS